jgi:hypothetical protein
VRHARELLALVVVLVGGTLWLVVPDMQGGSLTDDSVIARWERPPGEYLAGWMLVENNGPRTIVLREAELLDELPEDVAILGFRARLGKVLTLQRGYPGRTGPFFRLEGFRIPPNRGATIGVGLALPADAGTVALEDLRVTYLENGDENELRAGHTARICVRVSPRDC